jgi:hypothetical protein
MTAGRRALQIAVADTGRLLIGQEFASEAIAAFDMAGTAASIAYNTRADTGSFGFLLLFNNERPAHFNADDGASILPIATKTTGSLAVLL